MVVKRQRTGEAPDKKGPAPMIGAGPEALEGLLLKPGSNVW
jgi:hypothetical protein